MKNLAFRSPRSGNSSVQGEQRRSQRTQMVIPLEVAWHTADGTYVCKPAETQEVSAHGCLFRTKCSLPIRHVIALRCGSLSNWTLARVMRCDPPAPDGSALIAVELAVPSEVFWGKAA